MMKRLYKYICICLLAGLVSCTDEEPLAGQTEGQKITATAIGSEDESVFSRLGYQDEQNGGVTITWAEGDQFYMKGSNGASATMAILDGVGEKTARFTGTLTGGSMTDEESVSAYYPAAAYDAENECFRVDLRSITQECTSGNEMNHLSATYFMTGSGKNYGGDAEVSFVGGTKVAMLRFDLTLPKQTTSNLTVSELQIVCEDLKTVGTLAADGTFTADEFEESHRQKVELKNLTASTTADTKFSVYVNVLPTKITGNIRLKVMLSDETVYWCDVDLTNVELNANNRYYLVRGFLEEQKVGVDYSWYTSNKSAMEFEISTEAQLRALAKIVNNKAIKGVGYNIFKGKTLKIMNDIDLKVDWIPIGYRTGVDNYAKFCGTFDGNNKTISGIYCYDDLLFTGSNVAGFFGATESATIKDLTVKGKVKSTETYVGGLVGCNIRNDKIQSVIQNCRNEIDVISTKSSEAVGGIVGWARSASIIECGNIGKIESLKSANVVMGGIVGQSDQKTSIINCFNTAKIEGLKISSGCIGGIVGEFYGSSSSIVMACSNEGMIGTRDLSDIYIGGIVGRYRTASGTVGSSPGYVVANYNLANPLVDGEIVNRKKVAGLVAENRCYSGAYLFAILDIYGSYSLFDPLQSVTSTRNLYCDESSVVLSETDKNTPASRDLLNAGIYKWNTNTNKVCNGNAEGVGGNTDDVRFCNYHFEVGETHLIIKEGAPTAPAGTEEQ